MSSSMPAGSDKNVGARCAPASPASPASPTCRHPSAAPWACAAPWASEEVAEVAAGERTGCPRTRHPQASACTAGQADRLEARAVAGASAGQMGCPHTGRPRASSRNGDRSDRWASRNRQGQPRRPREPTVRKPLRRQQFSSLQPRPIVARRRLGQLLLGEFRVLKRCADERNVATVAMLAGRRQVHGSRGWSSRWNKPR